MAKKDERFIKVLDEGKTLSVACGDSSPRGRAKGLCEYVQFSKF